FFLDRSDATCTRCSATGLEMRGGGVLVGRVDLGIGEDFSGVVLETGSAGLTPESVPGFGDGPNCVLLMLVSLFKCVKVQPTRSKTEAARPAQAEVFRQMFVVELALTAGARFVGRLRNSCLRVCSICSDAPAWAA